MTRNRRAWLVLVIYACVEKRDVVLTEINIVWNELVHIEMVNTVRIITTQYLSSNHTNISTVKSLGTDIREQVAKKQKKIGHVWPFIFTNLIFRGKIFLNFLVNILHLRAIIRSLSQTCIFSHWKVHREFEEKIIQ